MSAYEITTVVHDARIEVDPSLEGQLLRVIILTPSMDLPVEQTAASAAPCGRFGTVTIPGKIDFLTRDDAHARGPR